MFYCGKDCQLEHWRKVHRNHCNYFSRDKGLEGTVVHQKETCSHCIMEEATGKAVYSPGAPFPWLDQLKAELISLLISSRGFSSRSN